MQLRKSIAPALGAAAAAGAVLLLAATAPQSASPSAKEHPPPVVKLPTEADPGAELTFAGQEPPLHELAVAPELPAATSQNLTGRLVAQVVVQEGETLRELAGRIYGRPEIAALLSRSGLPGQPEAGTRIEIPLAREIAMPKGSSLSRLARKHFGDGERWPVLAAFSGIPDASRCGAGTKVLLPARLRLRVRSGDSLEKLASLAWGNARGGNLIARWNGLPLDGWLKRGAWIEIPLPGPLAAAPDKGSAREL